MKLKIIILSALVFVVNFSYSQKSFIDQFKKNQIKELKIQKVINGERLKYYKRFVGNQRSIFFDEIDDFIKESDTIFIYEHLDELDNGIFKGWIWNKSECYQYTNKYVNAVNLEYCKISFDTVELFAKNTLIYSFSDLDFKKVKRNNKYTSCLGCGYDVFIKVIKKASGDYYYETVFLNGFGLFDFKRMTVVFANPVNKEILYLKNILWGIDDKEIVVITLDSKYNEQSSKEGSYILENSKTPFYFKFSNDTLDIIGCQFQIPDSNFFKTPVRFMHADSLEINKMNKWYKKKGFNIYIPISIQ